MFSKANISKTVQNLVILQERDEQLIKCSKQLPKSQTTGMTICKEFRIFSTKRKVCHISTQVVTGKQDPKSTKKNAF